MKSFKAILNISLLFALVYLVCLAFYSFAHSASYYQFTVKRVDESLEQVYETISEGDRVHLVFKSNGGYVSIADLLVDAIKSNKQVTGEIIDCSSACVTIAAAIGKEKLKVSKLSRIGLHSPYYIAEDGRKIPLDDRDYYRELHHVLESGGLDADMLIGITISTPVDSVHYLTVTEMKKAGFILDE